MSDSLAEAADKSVRGSLILFLGEAGSTIILAAGSILIARFLGPEYYGAYAISLAVPAILIYLIGLGLDEAIIRFSARLRSENRPKQLLSLMNSVIAFRLVLGLVMWLVSFLFSDVLSSILLNRPSVGFHVKLASFVIIFQTLFNLLYGMYVGLDRYDVGAIMKISMSIVKATFAPLLVLAGLGVIGAVLGHVLGFATSATIAMFMLYLGPYKILKSATQEWRENEISFMGGLKTMMGYGLPLYVSSLMLLLIEQYRVILLAYNVSDLEIGNFQAAVNFTTLLITISTPISMALFPAFSKLDNAGEEIRNAFQYSVKYTGMLIVPAAVFTILLSSELVKIVYGDKYLLAPLYFSLYAVMYLSSAFGSTVLDNFFNAIGKTSINLKAMLLYIISFIPLSFVLTFLYGVIGLILANITSFILKVAYGVYMAINTCKVAVILKNSVRILIATGVAATTTLPIVLNPLTLIYLKLILSGIIYLTTYITMLPIIKVLDKKDIEILRTLFSKYDKLRPVAELLLKYELKLFKIIEKSNLVTVKIKYIRKYLRR